jgi:hypothetical protein
VVRDNVDDEAHAPAEQLLAEAVQRRQPTQLAADLVVVEHVVAVGAPGGGREDGRKIEMGDAELLEVREQLTSLLEPETGVQLEAIRCRNRAVP